MKLKQKNILPIIFCPPYDLYKKPPKDQSKSHLINCPSCKKNMWMSEKKEKIINDNKDKTFLIECYTCFEKTVKKHPSIINKFTQMDI